MSDATVIKKQPVTPTHTYVKSISWMTLHTLIFYHILS